MAGENRIEVLMSVVDQMSGQLQSISGEFSKFKVSTEQNGKQIAQNMNNATKAFIGFVGLPVTLMAAGNALKLLMKETFGFGAEVQQMSISMGISIEEFLRLRKVAIATGTDMSTVQMGFMRLSLGIDQLREGSIDAQVQFRKFGVTFEDVTSGKMGSMQIFQKIGDYFSTIENKSKRTSEAIQLFGRSGAKLVEVLLETKKAGEFKILSEATVKALADGDKAINGIVDGLKDMARIEIGTIARLFRIITGKEGLPEPDFVVNVRKLKEEIQALEVEINKVKPVSPDSWNTPSDFQLERGRGGISTGNEEHDLRMRLRDLQNEREELVKSGKIVEKAQSDKIAKYNEELKLKQEIDKIDVRSGGNIQLQIEALTKMQKGISEGKDQWLAIQKIIDDLKAKKTARDWDTGWTAAMNHMRDASVDWGKSFTKIVDEIRDAFSDAFYSVGEMLITHTGTWRQTLRKFYQSIGSGIGREVSNAMGQNVTAQLGSIVGAGPVTGAGSAGAMAGAASVVMNPITLAVVAIASIGSSIHKANERAQASHKAQINYYQNMAANYREQGRILADELAKKVLETTATAEGGRGIEDVLASSLKATNATLKGLLAAADAMDWSANQVSQRKPKKKKLFH